ncbi:hypothetical protein LCGC14_1339320 [marine sediment metagenome]|uniref:Uncharacterized protein n=1 Tax=marine sediment metagenome TaxID=412755 RepID=A0A0F9L0H6_9ZZZZ
MSTYTLRMRGNAELDTDDLEAAKAFARHHGARLTLPKRNAHPPGLPSIDSPAIARRRETPKAYLARIVKTIKARGPEWIGEQFGRAGGGWRLVATDGDRLVAERCETETDPPLDSRVRRSLNLTTASVRVTMPETIGESIARLQPFRGDKYWATKHAVTITVADGRLSFALGPDQDGDSATEDICECSGAGNVAVNVRYLADTIGLPAVWHIPRDDSNPLVVFQADDTICHVIMPVRV